jgi:3-(methylthio)propanoyl-CoA dehydrogenase
MILKNSAQSVLEGKNNELIDFHARRLVEMAGYIIMGYLLLQDTANQPRLYP